MDMDYLEALRVHTKREEDQERRPRPAHLRPGENAPTAFPSRHTARQPEEAAYASSRRGSRRVDSRDSPPGAL